jgi:ELWxxDGT repeat protein
MKYGHPLLVIVLTLTIQPTVRSQDVLELVKDINPDGSSNPSMEVEVDGIFYGRAEDGKHGRELWRSDGTASGTWMLKDIIPGDEGSEPFGFTPAGTLVYFLVYRDWGTDLWRTDGTPGGTYSLIWTPATPWLHGVGSTLYFEYNDGIHGYELGKSDGTEDGTGLLKDIEVGVNSSNPRYLNEMNRTVYFTATRRGVWGIWKTDGTEYGTVLVKEFPAGKRGSPNFEESQVIGNILYFPSYDSLYGSELWRTDGSENGTHMVKDINPGWNSSGPYYFQTANGVLFFRANDGLHPTALWRSDGTVEGTVMLKAERASWLRDVGGLLLFAMSDSSHGEELWRSDGTEEGTVLLKDVNPGIRGSSPEYLITVDRIMYFIDNSTTGVMGIWRSDGTEKGTVYVTNLPNGNEPDRTFWWNESSGNNLLLTAYDSVRGTELWRIHSVVPSSISPGGYRLAQNYPNPFNTSTTIYYELFIPNVVRLSICNILGQEVITIDNEWKSSGMYEFTWDGGGYPSGLYFYRFRIGDYVETRKMVLLK